MQSDEQTVKISIDIGVCTQKSVVVHTISVKTHENYALLIRSSLTLKASLSNEGRRVTMPDFRNKSSSSILVVFLIVFQCECLVILCFTDTVSIYLYFIVNTNYLSAVRCAYPGVFIVSL